MPLLIFQSVQALHRRGYHQIRALPGEGGTGSWRVSITHTSNLGPREDFFAVRDRGRVIHYGERQGSTFGGMQVSASTTPDQLGDLILSVMPGLVPDGSDAEYARWFDGLVDRFGSLPVAYGDDVRLGEDWALGFGERYPRPPAVRS
jgi:hypothetical protein